MNTHCLQTPLWLRARRDDVFAFFADASNLEDITPPWLRFSLVTPAPIAMHAGARIDYRLRVRGVPLRWQSEITVWEPPFRFVDVQRRGPFRHWKHTHTFEEKYGGTLCQDCVEYAVPGGRLINWLIVRRDLERIFAHRQTAIRNRFQGGSGWMEQIVEQASSPQRATRTVKEVRLSATSGS